jgi:hypothetical protein
MGNFANATKVGEHLTYTMQKTLLKGEQIYNFGSGESDTEERFLFRNIFIKILMLSYVKPYRPKLP